MKHYDTWHPAVKIIALILFWPIAVIVPMVFVGIILGIISMISGVIF